MNPLAIVIPFYKISFFKDTLVSLNNQTNTQFQVYIGDDCAPVSAENLVKSILTSVSYKYVRFTQNLGSVSLTKHWERCLDLIQDETYVMILGDDDYLSETVVADFYAELSYQEQTYDLYRFASKMIDSENQEIAPIQFHPILEMASSSFLRKLQGLSTSTLSEYIFSKRTFKQHKFSNYPLAWHSDDMAWLKYGNGLPIVSINSSCVFVRVSNINITGRKDNLDTKRTATILFVKDLMSQNNLQLTKKQKIEILQSLEHQIMRNNIWNLPVIGYLCYQYYQNQNLFTSLKYAYRCLFLYPFLAKTNV